jgi:hypothetical protein
MQFRLKEKARRELGGSRFSDFLNVDAVAFGNGFEALRAIACVGVVRRVEQGHFDEQPAVSGFIQVLQRAIDLRRLRLLLLARYSGRWRVALAQNGPALVGKPVHELAGP